MELTMTLPWEGFSDITGLQQAERPHAQLETIAEFPGGSPEKYRLMALLEQIEQIYENEECMVSGTNNGSRIYRKIVGKQDRGKKA